MRQDNYKFWLGKIVTVKIDRPIDFIHPDFPKTVYSVNYGFIPDTFSEVDNEEIDAYVLGKDKPLKEFKGKVIAVIVRVDNEIKLIVTDGTDYSDKEIEKLTHFQEKYYKSKIVR